MFFFSLPSFQSDKKFFGLMAYKLEDVICLSSLMLFIVAFHFFLSFSLSRFFALNSYTIYVKLVSHRLKLICHFQRLHTYTIITNHGRFLSISTHIYINRRLNKHFSKRKHNADQATNSPTKSMVDFRWTEAESSTRQPFNLNLVYLILVSIKALNIKFAFAAQ